MGARPPFDRLISEIALGQHGLITDRQVLALGMSRSSLAKRVRSGRLVRVSEGVFGLPGFEPHPVARIHAAVLAFGDEALASHRSAAILHGAEIPSTGVDVIVPRQRRVRLANVFVHRPTDRHDLEPVVRRGIPTTSPLRTLMDLGAVASVEDVAILLDHLVSGRLVTVEAVLDRLDLRRKRGRDGVAALEEALDRAGVGSDSRLERVFEALVREHRLPMPVHHQVEAATGFELDWSYPALRVAIELDGFEGHLGLRAFDKDRARDAELTSRGWAVLRFTWRQLTERPAWVADCIRNALQARLTAA
jgi:very-short-patch-repair endonuclease